MGSTGINKREAIYIAEEIVRKSPGFAFDIGKYVLIFVGLVIQVFR